MISELKGDYGGFLSTAPNSLYGSPTSPPISADPLKCPDSYACRRHDLDGPTKGARLSAKHTTHCVLNAPFGASPAPSERREGARLQRSKQVE
jgi:hypothetical protein